MVKKASIGIIQRVEIQVDQVSTHICRRELVIVHILCRHRTNYPHLRRIFKGFLSLNGALSATERARNLVCVTEVADELRRRFAQMAFLLAGSTGIRLLLSAAHIW